MMPLNGGDDQRLDQLLQAYRQACSDPEPSANFMPSLWQRIESRQTVTFWFGRIARGFATAGVALSLAIGVYLSVPRSVTNMYASETYIDVLAASQAPDRGDIEQVSFDGGTADEL